MEHSASKAMRSLLMKAPRIPLVTLKGPEDWLQVGTTAIERGYNTIEVMLRSEWAEAGVRQLKARFPQLTVGLGTILSENDLDKAQRCHADFAVSPACSQILLEAAAGCEFPFLPGVMTPSDIMTAAAYGFHTLKLFPATAVGPDYIEALEGPFPWLGLCLSGGIREEEARIYADLSSVISISGSWLLKQDAK